MATAKVVGMTKGRLMGPTPPSTRELTRETSGRSDRGESHLYDNLRSELIQMKFADRLLQEHRERWMQYVELWMRHQDQVILSVNSKTNELEAARQQLRNKNRRPQGAKPLRGSLGDGRAEKAWRSPEASAALSRKDLYIGPLPTSGCQVGAGLSPTTRSPGSSAMQRPIGPSGLDCSVPQRPGALRSWPVWGESTIRSNTDATSLEEEDTGPQPEESSGTKEHVTTPINFSDAAMQLHTKKVAQAGGDLVHSAPVNFADAAMQLHGMKGEGDLVHSAPVDFADAAMQLHGKRGEGDLVHSAPVNFADAAMQLHGKREGRAKADDLAPEPPPRPKGFGGFADLGDAMFIELKYGGGPVKDDEPERHTSMSPRAPPRRPGFYGDNIHALHNAAEEEPVAGFREGQDGASGVNCEKVGLVSNGASPDPITGELKPAGDLDATCSDEEGCSSKHSAQSDDSEMPESYERWVEFVCLMLSRSTKKELRQLRSVWIQSETFLTKSLKSMKSSNNDEMEMFAGSSSRQHRSREHENQPPGTEPVEEDPNTEEGRAKARAKQSGSLVMNPTSPKRLAWVFIGMFLMLYDLVVFPLQVFQPEDNDMTEFMKYFCQGYWTLDIVASFFTGVVINGELCVRLMIIAKLYFRTWLTFDLLVTVPLWPIMLIPGMDESSDTQTLRWMRYVRMLRFLRLARLAKFEHLLGEALEFVNSSTVILCFGIVKLMVYLMILNHFNACMWYYVGRNPGGWTEPFTGRSMTYRYFCAMHWALTQFQGTSEIIPGTSLGERIYAAVFLLFALMILASFVSSLTNMMMQLQSLKDERDRQQRLVRSYLQANRINRALSMRVKRYVDWKLQVKGRQNSDADVLQILPSSLVVELVYEVRSPVFLQHKFFAFMDDAHSRIVRRLTHETMASMWQAPNELIFQMSEEADRMYFVTTGHLVYMVECGVGGTRSSGREGDDDATNGFDINADSFLCEQSLWVDWDHAGELIAVTDVCVMFVLALPFSRVMESHPPAHAIAVLYARQFLAALNCFGKNYTDYVAEFIVDPDVLRDQEAMMAKDDSDDEDNDGEALVEVASSVETPPKEANVMGKE